MWRVARYGYDIPEMVQVLDVARVMPTEVFVNQLVH
jgi:hypothetical protein